MTATKAARSPRSRIQRSESINGGLFLLNLATGIDSPWFLFPAIGWGIGLASQYGKLWATGYSIKDVLNPPPAQDAIRATQGAVASALPPAAAAPVSPSDFGVYAESIKQMQKDRAAIVQTMQRLPESEKELLPEVVETVDALMERASQLGTTLKSMEGSVDAAALQELDKRIEELKEQETGAETDRRLELLNRQRTSLEQLIGRRDKVENQFESCVLAVQNIRFDLLRLRSAGIDAVLSDITSATQQASALRIDVEAAIAAAGEIKEALGR